MYNVHFTYNAVLYSTIANKVKMYSVQCTVPFCTIGIRLQCIITVRYARNEATMYITFLYDRNKDTIYSTACYDMKYMYNEYNSSVR